MDNRDQIIARESAMRESGVACEAEAKVSRRGPVVVGILFLTVAIYAMTQMFSWSAGYVPSAYQSQNLDPGKAITLDTCDRAEDRIGNIVRRLFGPSTAIAQDSGMTLPDLTNAQCVGEQRVDKLSDIPGAETIMRGYLLNGQQIITYSFDNGRIYGFATNNDGTLSAFWDRTGDGVFEQTGEKFAINTRSYGIQ